MKVRKKGDRSTVDLPNPWLAEEAAVPAAVGVNLAAEEDGAAARGAAAPQPGIPSPDTVDRLPVRLVGGHPGLWVLGTHGGAGETRLAAVLPGARAAGHAWPEAEGAGLGPGRVLLVARTDAHGLRAAQRAAAAWASGTCPAVDLVGLVLIADAPGRLPRRLQQTADLVAGGVPRTWHLGWHEPWRTAAPQEGDEPRGLRRLRRDLTEQTPAARQAAEPSPRQHGTPVSSSRP